MKKLLGKIIIRGNIVAASGLHVGGQSAAFDIGGVDNSVVKDGDGKPYIPGSSLKGKLRSLLAKREGSRDFVRPRRERGRGGIYDDEIYIGDLFGVPAHKDRPQAYTRLFVRDAILDAIKLKALKDAATLYEMEFEYSDVKWENVIDRRTGAAKGGGLRQMERVPKGAAFDFEIVYDIYSDYSKSSTSAPDENKLQEHLEALADAMELLQDDYLGGQGSRGYGKVVFDIEEKDVTLKMILKTYEVVKSKEAILQAENQAENGVIWDIFSDFKNRLVALNSPITTN